MLFRKDINGLRAIAVIAVVLYHFDSNLLTGGFAGVDIFFVISGYLMTAIIFNGIEQETFTLSGFYRARAKRILPPLAVLCIVLLVYGWMNISPSDYRSLAKHAATSVSFISNFIYANDKGYFDVTAAEQWLLHTWSLSLEWQFYILYPLLILGLNKKFNLTQIKLGLLALTSSSFLLCLYMVNHFPEKVFFHLPFRAWELLVGGLIFLFPLKLATKTHKAIEIIGLIIILSSYIFISSANYWPSYLTLLPVLGASMIIMANHQKSFISNNIICQKLGSCSYSIYLWHWPIFVYLYHMGYAQNNEFVLLGILVSLILGWLSYNLIEQGKRLKYFPTCLLSPKWLFIITLMAAVTIYLLDGVTSKMRPYSISPQSQFLEKYKHFDLQGTYLDQCNAYHLLNTTGEAKIDPSCNESNDSTGGILLWGDSHAQALSLGLRENLPDTINFYQIASSGCYPSLQQNNKTFLQSNEQSRLAQACSASNPIALKAIKEIKPDIVIIAQANHHENTDWQEIYNKLATLGVKETVLIGPVPQWRPSLPYAITNRHWEEKSQYIVDQTLDSSILNTNIKLNEQLKDEKVTFISLIDNLCIDNTNKCLAKIINQELLVFDYGHLTPDGSRLISKQIIIPELIKRFSAQPGNTFKELAKMN